MIAEMEAANSAATEVDKPTTKSVTTPKKAMLAAKPAVAPSVEVP